MIKRVIDVTQAARVTVQKGQLLVQSEALGLNTCPIEDLGILLLSNPCISITQPAIASCAENNVLIITCDRSFTPVAVTSPLAGHSLQAKILKEQIAVSTPRKKRLWKQIVQRKISEQADTLVIAGVDPNPIILLIQKVTSGDSTNVEAQAAKIYWQELFGKGFRRAQDAPGLNGLLNYGYAVLRASVARAVVAAGLTPTLGLFHSNQFNSFALVDDLVEPYRPWIDEICFKIVREMPADEIPSIDKSTKSMILNLLIKDCNYSGKTYPFMVALHHFIADFRENLLQSGGNLNFIKR
jgi:CRISPR-associated protein Cas1